MPHSRSSVFRLPVKPALSSLEPVERANDTTMAAVPKQDVAAYIADLVNELRVLAREAGFETLSRVLEIAEREAQYRMERQP